MTVYIVAHAIGATFAFLILWAATALENAHRTPRGRNGASTRYTQENAPRLEIQPHRGDYSAWQASSIEGECDHV